MTVNNFRLFIIIEFWKRQNHKDRKQISDSRGLEISDKFVSLKRFGPVLYLDYSYSRVVLYVYTHRITHFRKVSFTILSLKACVCRLCARHWTASSAFTELVS